MKKKNLSVLMVIAFFICCSCSEKGGEANEIKIRAIDGIPHVYNTGKPLKGEVTLELEKVFEIDSVEIDRAQPPSFSQFTRSDDRIYLFDAPQFKIFIFDAAGKQLKQLQIKGQGPGEIERITQFILMPQNNDLWIPAGSKIIRYNREGKFLNEIKFKKRYRAISIIDENCFIGQYLALNPDEPDEMKRRKLFCMMFDREEKVLASYLEGEGLGGLPVESRNPSGQILRVILMMPTIVPDILYSLDHAHQLVYLCNNNDYVISLKNLKGEMLRVIHREHMSKLLTGEDRKEIIDLQFFRLPEEVKKLMADKIPPRFCAISELHSLPRGYLAVYLITGPQKYDIDIFDPEGRYIYRLKFPAGIESTEKLYYPDGGKIGMVESINDRDIYREYRVKNVTEIFGN